MGVFGGLTGSWGRSGVPLSSIVSHLLYSIRFCVQPNTVQLDNPVCSSGSRWCALCSDLLSQARAEEIHEGGEEGEPDGCNHFAGILHFILIYTIYIALFSIYLITCVFQYDKLYVDNKCYVWNDLQVKVGFPYKGIFWYLVESLFIFHRAAWLSLPQGNKVLTDQPFTRFVGKVFFWVNPPCPQARSHSPTKFRPLTSAGVSK